MIILSCKKSIKSMLKFANFYFFEYNNNEHLIINCFVVKNFLKTLFHGEDKTLIAND